MHPPARGMTDGGRAVVRFLAAPTRRWRSLAARVTASMRLAWWQRLMLGVTRPRFCHVIFFTGSISFGSFCPAKYRKAVLENRHSLRAKIYWASYLHGACASGCEI